MVIYRTTDRIPVKIGNLTFWLSPMSNGDRAKIYDMYTLKGGQESVDQNKIIFWSIKLAVKAVDGLEDATWSDGTKVEIKQGEDGYLTDESVEVLMNLDSDTYAGILSASRMATENKWNGAMKGVEIDFSRVNSVKKN